jgi:Ca-activated chloride channel family protein
MRTLQSTLIGAALFAAIPAFGQVAATSEPVIIVPQGRTVVIHPEPRRRPPQSIQLTTASTQVSIADQVASTTMVLSVYNPGGGQQEAQILVPVPEGASVRAFQLDGLGPEPNATLLPRDEARRIYNSIVQKSRDPGLLEFVGYSVIRSSVFPVGAGQTQTVRITYDHLLTADSGASGDRVDYMLPRTESLAATGVNWSVSVDIKGKRAISTVYSPSHELMIDRISDTHVSVRTIGTAGHQPGSFRLSYLLQRGAGELSATVMLYPDPEINEGKGGYFLLLTGLPAKNPADEQQLKREVTIVMDRSGSMRGEKIEQAREAVLQVVEGLKPGEYYNIIDFSDSISSFAERPVVKNEETIVKARAYIRNIQANGGTNIYDSLTEALNAAPTEGTLPVVLFLTDGLPTVGQTGESAIREAARKMNNAGRRVFTFGVGFNVNAPLLTSIARDARATSTFVLPEENVEVKVGQVFRRLSGPVLAAPRLSVVVKGGDVITRPIREMQPSALADQFEGDQMIILGQYLDSSAEKLVVEGNYFGKDRRFEFNFDSSKATTRNAFVPRLWASRKIASLIEEIRQSGADSGLPTVDGANPAKKELVDEIVRLSTKWGILTEYTAFLALEPGTVVAGGDTRGPSIETALRYSVPTSAPGRAAAPATPVPMKPADAEGAMNFDKLKSSRQALKTDGEGKKAAAREVLHARAVQERGGKIAVNQELNLSQMAVAGCENKTNTFWTKDLKQVEVTTVCQVHDQTMFKRADRWVDARILDKEAEAPEKTVEFGTPEFDAILDELVVQNRQGLLALGGDCYLQWKGQRVLVKAPSEVGTTE